jgi:hypothetical protein
LIILVPDHNNATAATRTDNKALINEASIVIVRGLGQLNRVECNRPEREAKVALRVDALLVAYACKALTNTLFSFPHLFFQFFFPLLFTFRSLTGDIYL